MEKLEYKKVYKELYLPPTKPVIIDVPLIKFAVVRGEGDPNGEAFAQATEALYAFSYAVKMSYKGEEVPDGFYDYTVFPLEGEWDLVDKSKSSKDKSNYAYAIMIRQPDFLTDALFGRFIQVAMKKKSNPDIARITYETFSDGLCCQMMHLGSYDDEPASFEKMEAFCASNGYRRISKLHREIYLSDPRKTDASKLKTVLRFKIDQSL